MSPPEMNLRYWAFSAASVLGALAMLLGVFWLNQATAQHVAMGPKMPAPRMVGTFPKPFSERQDVDVLLAIDFSGSMHGAGEEPPTDPDDLRLQAAELMATSLASDVFPRTTRMGYLAFGEDVETIQPFSSVESMAARKLLISKLRKPTYGEYTNIVGTLHTAYDMLFPGGKRASANMPSIVLLTDGDPRGGPPDNNERGIHQAVQRLTDKGTMVFVVILRNPHAQKERPRLAKWRHLWKSWSDHNRRLHYLEAQQAGELESIYNKIRARLVREGTRPGERTAYDPSDQNSAIEMPPNLLKANLLVGRPKTSSRIELVAPDGTPFHTLAQQDKRNEFLVTDLYYRYRIFKPQGGKWKLKTNSREIISYLLNTESLYSTRIAWPAGSPYISPDAPTVLPLVVIDPDGHPSDRGYELSASILRNVEQADGAIVEETIALPKPQALSDGITYQTKIGPDMIGSDDIVTVQVAGQASDGTLVNVSLTQLPVVRTPSDVSLQVPAHLECSDETLHLWRPEIRCGNMPVATLQIENGDRLSPPNSLKGDLFPPGRDSSIPMEKVDDTILQQKFGPLTTAGDYEVGAIASGKLGEDLVWKKQATATVQLAWPEWVDRWRKQLTIGAILLAICALWKPLIVALLLPLFRMLRLSPTGFYAESGSSYPVEVYRMAMRRRKLFTLTAGCWENRSLDVRAGSVSKRRTRSPRRGFRRLIPDMSEWLHKQPKGRLVTVPFRGLYTEADGEFDRCPDSRPVRMRVCGDTISVCQSDWTERRS